MAMERRGFLKSVAGVGIAAALSPRMVKAEEQAARATRGMPSPKIKDISVIECEPQGVRLTVVKITTDQDGSGAAGGGEISQAVSAGQNYGSD